MPTDEELRKWWESKGSPPITNEERNIFYSDIVEFLAATTVELWQEELTAPYTLYDLDGTLVETVGDSHKRIPVIKTGETITKDLANRIKRAAYPVKPKPIEIDFDEDIVCTQGEIDPNIFIGVHLTDDKKILIYEEPNKPQLLSWIERAIENA